MQIVNIETVSHICHEHESVGFLAKKEAEIFERL
jgi:hypothetical protein